MITIFATWDRIKRRWKFRDCVFMGSKVMNRRRRHFHQLAVAFVRVPEHLVLGVKRHDLAVRFYEWQEKVPWPNRFG